ncbi:hypothetical protein SAMN04489731_103632 [Amycolatopsis regifaucium]|nr:hypothetical protein SAMN04489731_103632 [Amycolatopsis regifaucium]
MPRPDGSDPSARVSVAPPRGATGKLNRSGYAVLGVSGLVVATAFAAIAELAGPGVSATAGGTGIPGGQHTSPAGIQLVPGNAVPGGPMTVSGEPIPGAPTSSTPPPTTVTSVGADGKETTRVVTPPPVPIPIPNPGPGPGPGPNPDPPSKPPSSSNPPSEKPPTSNPPDTSTGNPPTTTTTTTGGGASTSGAPDSSSGRSSTSGVDTSTSSAQ